MSAHKCAWCQQAGRETWTDGHDGIVAATSPLPERISHGMCLACAENFLLQSSCPENRQHPATDAAHRKAAGISTEAIAAASFAVGEQFTLKGQLFRIVARTKRGLALRRMTPAMMEAAA